MFEKLKEKIREQKALLGQQYEKQGQQFTQKVNYQMQQKIKRCKQATGVKHCRDCPDREGKVFRCTIARYEQLES